MDVQFLLFNSIFRRLNCFLSEAHQSTVPSSVALDSKHGHRLKLAGPTLQVLLMLCL